MPGVAILPFETLSSLETDAHFAAGLHAQLINTLQRSTGRALKVMGRQSVLAYPGAGMDPADIGRELAVGYLVNGSIQRGGDRVQVIVDLIDAESGVQLWSDQYDREMSPEAFFEIQAQVVTGIAGALQVVIPAEELDRAARRGTSDMRAYELRMRVEGLPWGSLEAAALLEEAVARDPDYLSAHAELAKRHAEIWQYHDRTPSRKAAALAAAERALALDSTSVDAQWAMGAYLYYTKEWDQALKWFDRIKGTLRGNVTYHEFRGTASRRTGHWQDALTSLATVIELDPQSGMHRDQHGMTLFLLHRFDEAVSTLTGGTRPEYRARAEWHRDGRMDVLRDAAASVGGFFQWEVAMYDGEWDRALELLTELPEVHAPLGTMWHPSPLLQAWAYQGAGRDAEAQDGFERAVGVINDQFEEAPEDARLYSVLGLAYAGLGRSAEAVEAALQAMAMMPEGGDAVEGPQYRYQLGAVYAQLGQAAEAVAVLDQLLSEPGWYTSRRLEVEFLMRPLRGDPRFQAMLDKHRGGCSEYGMAPAGLDRFGLPSITREQLQQLLEVTPIGLTQR